MTTTFAQSLLPREEQPSTQTSLKSFLLEPVLVVGAGLFWLTVLPITGLFCAGVALYDKIASLKAREVRLPDLRRSPAHNPLVLRKRSLRPDAAGKTSGRAPAFQS